jgi:hypothetical protein
MPARRLAAPIRRCCCALTATALLCAGGAQAATMTRDDGDRLRFTLDGPQLTVIALRPEAAVLDRPLQAICDTTWRHIFTPALSGAEVVPLSWPAGSDRVVVPFTRDISDRAAWCTLERSDDGGGDVGWVSFVAAEPVRPVAAGRMADGRPWRLQMWRNELQTPVGAMTVGRRGEADLDEHGFLGAIDRPAVLEAKLHEDAVALVWGIAPPAARRIEVVLRGGTRLRAPARATPAASRVLARWFAVPLPPRAVARRVTARDAAGRRLGSVAVPTTVENPND